MHSFRRNIPKDQSSHSKFLYFYLLRASIQEHHFIPPSLSSNSTITNIPTPNPITSYPSPYSARFPLFHAFHSSNSTNPSIKPGTPFLNASGITFERFFSTTRFVKPVPIKKNPIRKLLVANRGEIACRIMRTAKRLGIQTVSVHSDVDKHSKHVRLSDESVRIGPPASDQSYLNMDAIFHAAEKTGAEAIHPGYGFLSENSKFAKLCMERGVEFIGPSPFAIEAMGDKSASKSLMERASVPVVHGYHGDEQNEHLLFEHAKRINFPVLIKATKGGGGKGMRVVNEEKEFFECLLSAKREAMSSFGDDKVLIEKYISSPRHIEVQIFGDYYGDVVYLFERDCSIQRRHQKMIEESPAPCISEEFRKKIGETAVKAAKAVNYVNAGTVEFIVDDETKDFYFMEMNTRLQVEHPVTEMITGQDLVEWQIKISNGEKLPLKQNELKINGHAFEARIYAENVPRGFLPSTGILHRHRFPPTSKNVRVESGVRENDEISIYYDPMIAKLIVWSENRQQALNLLHDSLQQYQIAGVPTNISFLQKLTLHNDFRNGEFNTHFIPIHISDLLSPSSPSPFTSSPSDQILKSLCTELFDDVSHESITESATESVHLADKNSIVCSAVASACICIRDTWRSQNQSETFSKEDNVWSSGSGFRINHLYERHLSFSVTENDKNSKHNSNHIDIFVTYLKKNHFLVKTQNSKSLNISGNILNNDDTNFKLTINGIIINASVCEFIQDGMNHFHVWIAGKHCHFLSPLSKYSSSSSLSSLFDDEEEREEEGEGERGEKSIDAAEKGNVYSPLSGRVVKIFSQNGNFVKKNETILVLEAMKMEHAIKSPCTGFLFDLKILVGGQIMDEQKICRVVQENEKDAREVK